MTRPSADDAGSITVMVLGFLGVLVMLITVVTGASSVFLSRRSLDAATDSAALAAASALDEAALYDHTQGELPVDSVQAKRAVTDYVRAARLPARFTDFRVLSVVVDGSTVTVTFRCVRKLPFTALAGRYARGVPVTSQASAYAPLR